NEGTDSSPSDGKIDAGSVSPPATAKSTLTVGASENVRSSGGAQITWGQGWAFPLNPVRNDHVSNSASGLAAFSSRGPTLDNRLKPDIVAPGTNILSTRSSLGASSGWGGYNGYYLYMGGTSMSTPITAGTAALVRQYYNQTEGLENTLGSLVKATMINGAVDMTPGQYGSSNPTTQEVNRRPDIDQGWGRLNLKESLYPGTGRMTYVNQVDGIKTGENITRVFRVNSMEELRVTLAWSDYPGSYFSGKQLVNDLDHVLTSPDGDVYNGNDLSAPFDDTRDDINPVEGITVPDPQPGWWRVEVIGANVPRGPQHFGLVASGNITEFITNSMVFDRRYYSTDDGVIRLHLTGKDLIGSGTIKVNITSTSDPLGRMVTLTEEGEYGGFAGTIRTSNVTTEDPGKLYVQPDDDIYAWYSNSQYGFFYDAYSTAKKPRRVSLWYLPENHLVYSRGDFIGLRGLGEAGTDVQWTIEGSEMGWMPLWDDGVPGHGDELPSDGIFSDLFYVDSEMKVKGDLMLRVNDPFLGYLYYREFQLEIDTTRPRAPQDLKADPLPEGNSVELSWKRTGGSSLAYHSVYVNRTPLNLTHHLSNWKWLFNTTNGGNRTEVDGLVDGVEYYFRVATVDEEGNFSSLSHWALGVPVDITPPKISIIGDPFTLAGDAVLEFISDADLSLLEVEYYNDTDGNGTADDNNTWVPAGTSDSSVFLWNTREEAGGPGNLENMIIRVRGSDEVPNTGNWTEFSGYAVDNIGPITLRFDTFPGRITNVRDYENLLGTSEPLSSIELYVNDELQNSTVVGQSGLFGLPLKLNEGYNLVNLTGHDRHGAGPVVVNYEFTLDTQHPVSKISDFNTTIEILPDGVTFVSSSYDIGDDPEFTRIKNTTWVLVLPTGERRITYGEEVHVIFEMLGNHSIEVRVRDMAGNTNSSKVDFVVRDTLSPVLELVGDLVVDEDTSVEYSSEGTYDNDPCAIGGKCAYYNWTFTGDDGWTYYSERWETTVVFPDPGSYDGSLTVADSSGNSANLTFRITVNDITPPEGDIQGPVKIELGEVLNLTAVFTDNDPLFAEDGEYLWIINFLDERGVPLRWGEREGKEMDILFEDPGNYTFQVTVTDASGNSRKADHRVWVKETVIAEEEEELTPEERSWTLIIIIAVIVLIILVLSSILVWRLKREDVRDVDWDDEDDEIEELDDIDLDEEDEEDLDFEFDEDDWED
ncbi:MAG: S8 family serine peptidase, partial [Thermoplasmatota archaeon]